jgi:dihydroorotate dehydrogenase (fumarate)
MNLRTTYLGLDLANPLIPGASPLGEKLDTVRVLEDSGAAAIVLPSLFEEQLARDQWSTFHHQAQFENTSAEAASYFPPQEDYRLGPEEYLEHIRRVKSAVAIPVIASLNGTLIGSWIDHARAIEQAGADALELNTYHVATDPTESGDEVESRTLDILRAVRSAVKLPLAVKLSPYYSSLAHLAVQLEALGANGLVLFNRFYQPDIDPVELETVPRLELSTAAELRLRLRWLGILSPHVKGSLACSGGVHRAVDVVKAIMAGANAVQVVSALLHLGPKHLRVLGDDLQRWMEENEFASVPAMRGVMNLDYCPDPAGYERANSLRVLQLWKT